MQERATSVLLREGAASKLFAAEITNSIGNPVRNVEVMFLLSGDGSLAADSHVSSLVARTDSIGCAMVSVNRPSGVEGALAASLSVQCPTGAGAIRLRLVAQQAVHSWSPLLHGDGRPGPSLDRS